MTKKNKIILSIVTVLVLLGMYIFFDRKLNETEDVNNDPISQATSTSNGAVTSSGSGGYTVEQVPITSGGVPKPIPDLDRQAVTYSGAIIAPEAKEAALPKIRLLQTSLKTNPADFSSWLDLGIYQKMAGDYDGAIISWKYAGKLAPTDYISVANLGNIYAYFIKDNAQAEIYYKLAISKSPTQAYLYTQLAEVYRDVFKDLDKARSIVNEGLSKIPNDANLLQLKASLQ